MPISLYLFEKYALRKVFFMFFHFSNCNLQYFLYPLLPVVSNLKDHRSLFVLNNTEKSCLKLYLFSHLAVIMCFYLFTVVYL